MACRVGSTGSEEGGSGAGAVVAASSGLSPDLQVSQLVQAMSFSPDPGSSLGVNPSLELQNLQAAQMIAGEPLTSGRGHA